MASSDSGPAGATAAGSGTVSQRPQIPGVPGVIDGSMTMQFEPTGSVSFRLIIGPGGECAARHDVLEIIISSEAAAALCREFANRGAQDAGESESVPLIPCHIGFCRNAVIAAA